MISWSSLLVALVLYSVVLAVVCQLRWRTSFLQKHGVSILLVVTALATVRLLLPFEIPLTHAVRSWAILGPVQAFFHAHPAILQVILAVWFIGAVVAMGFNIFFIYLPHKECRSYISVKSELVEQVAQRCGVRCPVKVSPDVDTPFVLGVFRHTIYLPSDVTSEQYIELALNHELQHIRNHDALIKVFFGCLWAVLWWNPMLWIFLREINSMLELRCDAKVMEQIEGSEQAFYLDTMVELSKHAIAHRSAYTASIDAFLTLTPPNSVEQRFRLLCSYWGRPLKRIKPWVYCLLAALFFMSYLVVFQPASAPPAEAFQDDYRTTYKENYDGPEPGDGIYRTFVLIGPDNRYQLYIDYEFRRYLSADEIASDKYQHLYVFQEAEH